MTYWANECGVVFLPEGYDLLADYIYRCQCQEWNRRELQRRQMADELLAQRIAQWQAEDRGAEEPGENDSSIESARVDRYVAEVSRLAKARDEAQAAGDQHGVAAANEMLDRARAARRGAHPDDAQLRKFGQAYLSDNPPIIASGGLDALGWLLGKPQELVTAGIAGATGWDRKQQVDVVTVMTSENRDRGAIYDQQQLRNDPSRAAAETIYFHATDPWTYTIIVGDTRAALSKPRGYGRLDFNAAPRGTGRVAPSATSATNPRAYSTAFQMRLPESVLGRSRGVHFNRANAALDEALAADAQFAGMMDDLIPGVRQSVSSVGGRQNPTGWTWEHVHSSQAGGEIGTMRLVPTPQHTPRSAWWRVLHPQPGATGGYSEWAIPRGAPPN